MKLKTKKGQAHLTETIAVLFIFFVLILFSLIFYYRYQGVALKEQQEEMLANRAMETTIKTLFLPELLCSKGEAEPEENCLDLAKVRAVNTTFLSHLNYYFETFSYANITVQELYPDNANSWVIYEKVKGNFTRKEPTYFVVTLREDLEEKKPAYRFGYIKVEVYS